MLKTLVARMAPKCAWIVDESTEEMCGMVLSYTAEAETENGLVEFGGTFVGDIFHDDCRLLFAAAREVAAAQAERNGYPPDSFAVTSIIYTN
jgi:hypothetical protein